MGNSSDSVLFRIFIFGRRQNPLRGFPRLKRRKAMALYLVQHGRSLPKEISPEQGLSEEGIAEVERIAQVAKGYHIKVRQIRHSTKARARQTAAVFQAALDPKAPMAAMEGLKPLDDVASVASGIFDEPWSDTCPSWKGWPPI